MSILVDVVNECLGVVNPGVAFVPSLFAKGGRSPGLDAESKI